MQQRYIPSRVVNKDSDISELFTRRVEHCRNIIRAGNVRSDGNCHSSGGIDLTRRPESRFRTEIVINHSGVSAGGEEPRRRKTYPTRTARHKHCRLHTKHPIRQIRKK